MANYTPSTLTGDLAPVNAELEKIASAIDDQADRNPAEGEANQMENTLDMNSQSLINLPEPVNANDAARLVDVQVAVSTGLPDQTGNAGKFLSTDGSVVSWEETLTSVNGQTGVVVLDTDDIDDSSSTNKYVTQSQIDKIDDLEQTTLTSVANVTALRSFEPTADNQQISLVEHTSGGKGGGVFYFDATDSTTADNNGTVIVTSLGRRWKRIYETLDVTMFGAIGDGITNSGNAIESAINLSNNIDEFTANGLIDITLTESGQYKLDEDVLKNISLSVSSTPFNTVTASNISRFEDTVTLTNNPYSVGDVVKISGTISHEDYTPSRYTSLEFVARVRSINGLAITLDRQIDYILTSVSVSQLLDIQLAVNADLESSKVVVSNIPFVTYKGKCSGSVGTTGGASFVTVNNAALVKIDAELDNAECVLGIANNNISGGVVNIVSNYSGNDTDTETAKVYRANGIQGMTVNGQFTSSRNADSVVYAARDCTFNIQSEKGGARFWDSGSTAANRIESVQFSEGDRIIMNGQMVESNDQCCEMLACTESVINGSYANGVDSESTEGAIVVKGAGRDVTVNAKVKGFNSRAIKFEVFDGGTGFKTSDACEAVSNSAEAITVRDAASAYDTKCQIRGNFNGVGTVIEVRENSDGVTVDAEVNMFGASGAGVFIAASDWSCNVRAYNTVTNKTLLSIGNTATNFTVGVIKGDSDDVGIQFNNNSIDLFNLQMCNLVDGRIDFGGESQYFKMRGGQAYSNVVPTRGVYQAGDFYRRESFNSPSGNDENLFGGSQRLVEIGRVYDGSTWRQEWAMRTL